MHNKCITSMSPPVLNLIYSTMYLYKIVIKDKHHKMVKRVDYCNLETHSIMLAVRIKHQHESENLTCVRRDSSVGSLKSSLVLPFSVSRLT